MAIQRPVIPVAVPLIALLCVHLLRLPASSLAPSPLFAGSGLPAVPGAALSFCGYTGINYCNQFEDAALREQFEAMNVSDDACAAIVKGILCAICNPMELLNTTTDPSAVARSIPLLCTTSDDDPGTSTTTTSPQHDASTMCVERIDAGTYIRMVAHPDGSGRVFLLTQDGEIWLASVPTHGSGATLRMDDGKSPFLDLSDRVPYNASQGLGLMDVAFDQVFAKNGRFFISYKCDSASPACGTGKCFGASAVANGSMPCGNQLVVAEFSAKGGHDHSKATHGEPYEVKRIFTMGLPKDHASYDNKHAGQILFRPTNGYLYLIVPGHSGDEAKYKRLPYGKIITFDVDSSTPNPNIFAIGLNNPRGCSFNSERPFDLYCADVHEQQYEQVYSISGEDGSYVASLVVDHGRPTDGRAPSIVGGLIYRGSADPSLKGRYLYMYNSTVWTAVESPSGSGGYHIARIPNIMCSESTPIPCHRNIGERILSFGEDNNKDAILLATGGVYRVVAPGLCGNAPPPPQPTHGWLLPLLLFALVLIAVSVCTILGGGGQIVAHCCHYIMCCVNVTNNNGNAENPAPPI
ncbi:hypothetical protein ACP70R_032294 [Stipagrostis hirtigluma subsp. patula]